MEGHNVQLGNRVACPRAAAPLSVARVSDRPLLRRSVAAALREAEDEAETLSVADRVLGLVQSGRSSQAAPGSGARSRGCNVM